MALAPMLTALARSAHAGGVSSPAAIEWHLGFLRGLSHVAGFPSLRARQLRKVRGDICCVLQRCALAAGADNFTVIDEVHDLGDRVWRTRVWAPPAVPFGVEKPGWWRERDTVFGFGDSSDPFFYDSDVYSELPEDEC